MNRPKIEDYYNYSITEYSIYSYINDLNEYCNSIEKALDKACEILDEGYGWEDASYRYHNGKTYEDIPYYLNNKEWKEWLLNDS